MKAFEATAIATILALVVYIWTSIEVGKARSKHNVKAPATTGPDEFNAVFRVQQNTLEQLVLFLPALWLAHAMVPTAMWVPIVGLVWSVGRVLYAASYRRDPASRSKGFMLTFLPSVILLVAALVFMLMRMF